MHARLLLALGSLLLVPCAAHAEARAYRGPHPVDLEGHWHLEDATHVHEDLAVGAEPFGDVDGVLVFLADPLAFGWTGDVWSYRGAHPMPGGITGYCGLSGEHRHPFAPEGSFRREADGTYVFTGALRGGVAMVRPGRVAPRHPIVTADRAPYRATPSLAPYWLGGCLHTPLDGCVPRARHRRRAAPAPAPPPSSFAGRYSRVESRPGVAPRRVDRPRQSPDR